MKVFFKWSSQFCGEAHDIKDIPANSTNKDIEDMFEEVLGVPYDENCYYKILEEPTYRIGEAELLHFISYKIAAEKGLSKYYDLRDILQTTEKEARELIEKEYRSKIIP